MLSDGRPKLLTPATEGLLEPAALPTMAILSTFSDRFGRRPAVVARCSLGSLGRLVSAMGATWTSFAPGAATFAMAAAIVNPAAAAATMDRARAGRTDASMATLSIGDQVAAGIGRGAGRADRRRRIPGPIPRPRRASRRLCAVALR